MNKNQAMVLLMKGAKVSHSMFTDSEYIMKHKSSKSHYVDEAGNVIGINDFWKWRTGPKWDKDWKVFIK